MGKQADVSTSKPTKIEGKGQRGGTATALPLAVAFRRQRPGACLSGAA